MKDILFVLTTAAAFALPATAQRSLVLPAEYDRAWGRGSTSLLGNPSTRTQMVFAQPFALGTPVFGIGLRCTASTTDRAAFTADVEIQMSSTTAMPGALSSTFASNVGTDMVVAFPRQTVTIPAMPANRSTGTFASFTFPQPFVFGLNAAPNILVEVMVYSRSTGASWSTDRAFASTNGRAANAGLGCGSAAIGSTSTGTTSTGTYIAGSTISLTLSSAPANSLALLVPTFDQKELAPGLPLPFDLALVGAAPGCDLLVNPQFGSLATVTDVAGAASISATIPATLARVGTGWQWLYPVTPTPANPAGIETTASRAIWIGPEVVVPGAQYIYSLTSATSATGTANVDSVPIVQFVIP